MREFSADSNDVKILQVEAGEQGAHVERVYRYLQRFGYFPNEELSKKYLRWSPAVDLPPKDPTTFGEELRSAVRIFQRAYGLEETGQVNRETAELMNRPRCGVPDNLSMHAEFVTEGSKWSTHDLTYTHDNYSPDLSQNTIRSVIRGALDRWSKVSPLNFREHADGDLLIGFYSGNHGDGDDNAFDGAGTVLAHCFYPPPSGGDYAGDCHFDEAETWSNDIPASGTDLASVALHELGHGIGLEHSGVSTAVMYAYYNGPRRELTRDDIQGVQAIYGARFPDWQLLDANPATSSIVADGNQLYQLHADGKIWRYTGTPMTGWQLLDNNPATKLIAASWGRLYQLHKDGKIWRFTGTPMTGWQLLDANPSTATIVTGANSLYQMHNDGKIWRYTGTPMTGWQLLDNNPATKLIAAAGSLLYQLHADGKIWRYTGPPMTGWQQLDNNRSTMSIVAAGSHLYQLHTSGKIWRYTGIPMTGWQMLDNNPSTTAIVAGNDHLYQIHKNGWIWRYTGTPLTGWRQLDDNPDSQSLCASGDRLYQKHRGGKIWRYTK